MQSSTYFRLMKFDPFSGIAIGVCAAAEPDRDNEIMDYEKSKPYFQEWSASVHKDSQGKSFGNIRFQHDDKRPVGLVIAPLEFDDARKQIRVQARVIEPEARRLLETGALTGFSIGGAYVSKTPRPDGLTSYVANPCEISVVDRPCVPSATFEIVKAGVVLHKRYFKSVTQRVNPNVALAKAWLR
jgi:hypothetical protein